MTIETKFNKFDTVYYMNGDKVKCNPINAIDIRHQYAGGNNYSTFIKYRVEGDISNPNKEHIWVEESKLFISKEELLKSL